MDIILAMHAVIIADNSKQTVRGGVFSDVKIRADFCKIVVNFWYKVNELCLNIRILICYNVLLCPNAVN